MRAIIIRWPEHPLVRGLPILEGTPYRRLVTSVRTHGLREPIRLADGMMIDGRARLRACQELGIPIEIDEVRRPARWLIAQRRREGKPLEAALIERRAADLDRHSRRTWIRRARESFHPGDPEPCAVCGKYKDVAHAHHLTPLHTQADHGVKVADQAFVWLCPTHHAAIHALLDRKDWPALEGFSARERAALKRLAEASRF